MPTILRSPADASLALSTRPDTTLRELVPALARRAHEALRRRWLRATLKHAGQRDAHRRVELAYVVADPWGMATEREQHRFRECNRLLRDQLITSGSRTGSILEIGCGEGHQTEHLARLCDRVSGLDVSRLAVERARRRLPEAELWIGDLPSMPWADQTARFDVVTAFEILYFVKDVPGTLDRMSRLGRSCMVSWFARDAGPVADHVLARGVDGTATIRWGDTHAWTVAWWRKR